MKTSSQALSVALNAEREINLMDNSLFHDRMLRWQSSKSSQRSSMLHIQLTSSHQHLCHHVGPCLEGLLIIFLFISRSPFAEICRKWYRFEPAAPLTIRVRRLAAHTFVRKYSIHVTVQIALW
jgi:hypothetical protein